MSRPREDAPLLSGGMNRKQAGTVQDYLFGPKPTRSVNDSVGGSGSMFDMMRFCQAPKKANDFSGERDVTLAPDPANSEPFDFLESGKSALHAFLACFEEAPGDIEQARKERRSAASLHLASLTYLEVAGAGTEAANGIYARLPLTRGGRGVWVKTDDSRWMVQWSLQSRHWMIDYVPGDAPYCIPERDDEHVPLDAAWHSYMGGAAPVPTVRAAEAVSVAIPQEVVVVSGAGLARVNGAYRRLHEFTREGPVWAKLDDDGYRIRAASSSYSTWLLVGPNGDVFYVATGKDSCAALPLDARWNPGATGPGVEPGPVLNLGFLEGCCDTDPAPAAAAAAGGAAVCVGPGDNLVAHLQADRVFVPFSRVLAPEHEDAGALSVSGTGDEAVDGVYRPVQRAEDGRAMWARAGDASSCIKWSPVHSAWILGPPLAPRYASSCDWALAAPPLTKAAWAPLSPSASSSSPAVLDVARLPGTELDAAIVVEGAGTAVVNGVYLKQRGRHAGRPFWTKVGNDCYRILWSSQSLQWIVDNIRGNAPYCLRGNAETTLPLDACWQSYMGGLEPMPSVTALGAEIQRRKGGDDVPKAENEAMYDLLTGCADPTFQEFNVESTPRSLPSSPTSLASKLRTGNGCSSAPDANGASRVAEGAADGAPGTDGAADDGCWQEALEGALASPEVSGDDGCCRTAPVADDGAQGAEASADVRRPPSDLAEAAADDVDRWRPSAAEASQAAASPATAAKALPTDMADAAFVDVAAEAPATAVREFQAPAIAARPAGAPDDVSLDSAAESRAVAALSAGAADAAAPDFAAETAAEAATAATDEASPDVGAEAVTTAASAAAAAGVVLFP
eukprot:TRINITY_DN54079_c0_g1_i1.p1 TRINITY_DN54079_c0_g1~~TRINITY_DN54079_c0_g1_i1.p1  ORF type:complete len:849 (+),score=182.47 TRINITY_DN54079_c0_g1_i1:57-2603(+)